jgi:hypothetical protein
VTLRLSIHQEISDRGNMGLKGPGNSRFLRFATHRPGTASGIQTRISNRVRSALSTICDQQHQAEKFCRKQISDCRSTTLHCKKLIRRLTELERGSQLIEVMIGKMRPIQFGLIVNLIQTKSMKVIDKMQHMMNQEFQHCSESQLIEGMNMKMHSIQFALIVNLIQMKSMKVIHIRENRMNQKFRHCPGS